MCFGYWKQFPIFFCIQNITADLGRGVVKGRGDSMMIAGMTACSCQADAGAVGVYPKQARISGSQNSRVSSRLGLTPGSGRVGRHQWLGAGQRPRPLACGSSRPGARGSSHLSGVEAGFPVLQADSLLSEPPGKHQRSHLTSQNLNSFI